MTPDIYSAEKRSELMRNVRTRDTAPEIALRRALWAAGLRGWRCHRRDLPGRPDIAFGRHKLAVFVDGAFWHGHPSKFRAGQSGPQWDAKIARNIERDHEVDARLADRGWHVVRVWDFEVSERLPEAIERIQSVISNAAGHAP